MMPWPRAVGQGADMDWARILTYVTGTVDQDPSRSGQASDQARG
jgi:hypothetical protein